MSGGIRDRFCGQARFDRLRGQARPDRFRGQARLDRLRGQARLDRLRGQARFDRFRGQARFDRLRWGRGHVVDFDEKAPFSRFPLGAPGEAGSRPAQGRSRPSPRAGETAPPTEVATSEMIVTRGGRCRASAIGSCVVVVLCDPSLHVVGMAHVMLPGRAPLSPSTEAPATEGASAGKCRPERGKYAETALEDLLRAVLEAGACRERLVACVAGGGNVLRRPDDTLCAANVASVRRGLDALGISLVAEDLGGSLRRSLAADGAEGRIVVTRGDGGPELLWAFPCEAGELSPPDDDRGIATPHDGDRELSTSRGRKKP